MSGVSGDLPRGVLRKGWATTVGDYAIAGGWTPGGEALVVGDAAGGVYAFDGKSGETAWVQSNVHEGGVLAVAIHPSEPTFATAGQDGRVLVWDAGDGQIRYAIDVGKDWVENIAWSSKGQWLAASISRQVRVFGAEGAEVWRSEDHPSTVSAVTWSDADELATACYGRVSFFDGGNGSLRQKLEWKGSLVSMALSPDGDIVACGSQDNSVHFWRRSIEEDSMMSGYPAKPSALTFDEAGKLLATSGGETIIVWSFRGDGPEGTEPGMLTCHLRSVTALSFARRGNHLASGGRDGAVVVWAVKKDGKGRPAGAAVVDDVVSQVYWRPDGRALAALDSQGGVTTWRVSN